MSTITKISESSERLKPGSKHVPERTCVGCHQKMARGEFIRIVRRSPATMDIDLTGKKPGRGAYLCKKRSCWEIALSKNSLAHALRISPSVESRSLLEAYGRAIPEGPGQADGGGR